MMVWIRSNNIKTIANGLVGEKKFTLLSFGPKKGAHFNFTIQEIPSIGYHLLWPLKDIDLVILVRSDSGLSFAWVRQVKARVKSSPFKLWQVLAIPCSIASIFFFHFTPSVMHKHRRIKQTAAATIVSYFHRMSVNNNPVSSKRNHGYHSTNNIIIAHARMRTPTEELEYACFAAWFHSSTCNLFFCVFF